MNSQNIYSTSGSTHGNWINDTTLPESIQQLTEEDLLIGLAGLGSLRHKAKYHAFDIYRSVHEFDSPILRNLVTGSATAMETRQLALAWVIEQCS